MDFKCSVYWGWVVCFSFLVLFTLSAGVAFSFNEIIIPLSKDIHSSMAMLDLLGSLPSSLPMLLAPLATVLHFKIGTRKTVIIGVITTSAAIVFAGLSKHFAMMFILYGLLGGFGITLIINPPFFLLDEYFPYEHPRHVLATSVIACAFPLATLSFNPISYGLISVVGWRGTYFTLAACMLVIGILTSLTFRKPSDSTSNDKLSLVEEDKYSDIDTTNVNIHIRTKVIIGTGWLIASMLKGIGYYTPFLTLVKQMDSQGIAPAQSTLIMTVVGSCELISRLITSYVGDYVKGHIMYAYVFFSFCLCGLNMWATTASTYVHFIIYAAALGSLGGPIIAAMYSSCSEVIQGQWVPQIFTIFRVGLGAGSIAGPMTAGYIFDKTESFRGVYCINSAVYLLLCVLYWSIVLANKYKPSLIFPMPEENTSESDNTDSKQSQLNQYTKLIRSFNKAPASINQTSEMETKFTEHTSLKPKS